MFVALALVVNACPAARMFAMWAETLLCLTSPKLKNSMHAASNWFLMTFTEKSASLSHAMDCSRSKVRSRVTHVTSFSIIICDGQAMVPCFGLREAKPFAPVFELASPVSCPRRCAPHPG